MTTPPDQPGPPSAGEPPTQQFPAGSGPAPYVAPAGDVAPPYDPDHPEHDEHDEKKRPWAWIGAAALLGMLALGFALWAFDLNGDLSDQQDATKTAQQTAAQAAEDAKRAADEESKKASDRAGALSDQIDSLTQAVEDASDALASATEDARDGAQSQIEDLRKRLEELLNSAEDATGTGGETPATTP